MKDIVVYDRGGITLDGDGAAEMIVAVLQY